MGPNLQVIGAPLDLIKILLRALQVFLRLLKLIG